MINSLSQSIEHAAGSILVLANISMFPGLIMFWIRGGQRGGQPPSHAYYVWERSLILAAVILIAIGFLLLIGSFQTIAGQTLMKIGAYGYLFGGILVTAAEALNLSLGYEEVYPLVAVYAITAFLAQAFIGGALLQSGLVAPWIGWASISWNLLGLILIPIVSPHDIYFPVLHSIAPLLIGIALLLK